MTPSTTGAPPPGVERFVKRLLVALKAVRLYPPTSRIPRDSVEDAIASLREHLERSPEMRLVVTKHALEYAGSPIDPDRPAFQEFAREFYTRHIAEVRFHSGTTPDQLLAFLSVLDVPVESVESGEDVSARLWDAGVVDISVNVTTTRVIERVEEAGGDGWPPPPERVDEAISGALGGRPAERRLLLTVLSDRNAMSGYLSAVADRPGRRAEAWVAGRMESIVHAIEDEPVEEREAHLTDLAEALAGLPEELRARVVRDRLLPDARHDEAVAQVIRTMGVEKVCRLLAVGSEEGPAGRDGLARALRNLMLITLQSQGEVTDIARDCLAGSGVSSEDIDEVIDAATPERLRGGGAVSDEGRSLSRVLELVDAAARRTGEVDREVEDLAQEAAESITDADVLHSLLAVAWLEHREEEFFSLMGVIRDGMEILIERREFVVAADAVELLTAIAKDPVRATPQRESARDALSPLMVKRRMRMIVGAMHVHDRDTDEYAAARRLLAGLGGEALGPLLEVLADEPDRRTRKALVELASAVADEHVEELAEHLGDGRWYFVRNVVTILGSSRRSEAARYLERTLRYPDARVRRETIRAAAGLGGAIACEVLRAALADEDPQNVRLAARYLGSMGDAATVRALEEVARGEGRGARGTGPRVEAIEALGLVGDRDSAEVLRKLTHGGRLLGRRRWKEIRVAARSALERLETTGRREEGDDDARR